MLGCATRGIEEGELTLSSNLVVERVSICLHSLVQTRFRLINLVTRSVNTSFLSCTDLQYVSLFLIFVWVVTKVGIFEYFDSLLFAIASLVVSAIEKLMLRNKVVKSRKILHKCMVNLKTVSVIVLRLLTRDFGSSLLKFKVFCSDFQSDSSSGFLL